MQTIHELAIIEFVQHVLCLHAGELAPFIHLACPRPAPCWRSANNPDLPVVIHCACRREALTVYSPTLRDRILIAGPQPPAAPKPLALSSLFWRSTSGTEWHILLGQCRRCHTIWCDAAAC